MNSFISFLIQNNLNHDVWRMSTSFHSVNIWTQVKHDFIWFCNYRAQFWVNLPFWSSKKFKSTRKGTTQNDILVIVRLKSATETFCNTKSDLWLLKQIKWFTSPSSSIDFFGTAISSIMLATKKKRTKKPAELSVKCRVCGGRGGNGNFWNRNVP